MSKLENRYSFYRVLRSLDVRENIANSNQLLRTAFEAGDILRSEKSLPGWLTGKKADGVAFVALLDEEEQGDYFDIALPDYLYQLEFKKV